MSYIIYIKAIKVKQALQIAEAIMFKKIVALLLILTILTAIYNLGKQISAALAASDRLDASADQLNKLEQQNRELHDKLAQTSQYDFIEETARNKLGMSKPDETVVVIPQSDIEKVLGLERKPVVVQIPNWQGWLKLIFH